MQTIIIKNFKKLLALIYSLVFLSLSAYGQDISTVKNIDIELNLKNNQEYRKKALNLAYKIAITRYLNWITLEKKEKLEKIIDTITIKDFVSGYSINNEKFKKNNYSALISVNLDKKKVKGLLDSKSIEYIFKMGPKTLIIPLMNFNNRLILWDDPNPWFEAWLKRPLDSNLNKFVLPAGEIDDLITLNALDAKDLKYYKLKNISIKYGSKNILVVIVNVDQQKDSYTLDLKVYNGLKQEEIDLEGFNFLTTNNFNQDLFNIANEFADYYDDLWVKNNIENINLKSSWSVEIKYTKFSEWIEIKNMLLNNDRVTNLVVTRLSNKRAVVNINVTSADLFFNDLEKTSYKIERNNNNLKIIYKK